MRLRSDNRDIVISSGQIIEVGLYFTSVYLPLKQSTFGLLSPDRHMQINEGMFGLNGRCGYVLKPDCMHDKNFDPFDKRTLNGVDPIHLTITVSTTSL